MDRARAAEECITMGEAYDEGYEQGRADERKKIMEILDSAADVAQAILLLYQYIISKELKEAGE